MKDIILLYSHFGSILTRYNEHEHDAKEINIDFVQVHRFITSCFTFSKCNCILSHFNQLNILAINGEFSCIVLISTDKLLYEQEFVCNILLYSFEIAYHSQLKEINDEESKITENMIKNYTVHSIRKEDEVIIKNKHFQHFSSFQYTIKKLTNLNIFNRQTITNITDKMSTDDCGIILIDSENKTMFEYSSHIICNKIKQVISEIVNNGTDYDGNIFKLKTWNGIWNISSCKLKMWCDFKLFFFNKYSNNNINNAIVVICKLKNYFQNLMFGHHMSTILKHIHQVKQEYMIKPKPPCIKQNSKDTALFSRKAKYKKRGIQPQHTNSTNNDGQVDILLIPPVQMASISST
eukprot:324404_1